MSDRSYSFPKPLLTVAALGAAAAFLGVYKVTRRSRSRSGWLSPRAAQPTLVSAMARSALVSAAASLSSYVVGRLQRALEERELSPVGLPGADDQDSRSAELL